MRLLKGLCVLLMLAWTGTAQAQTNLWTRNYNGVGNGDDYATACRVDASGNTYTLGRVFNGSNDDIVVTKYDTSGTLQWARRYNGGHDDNPNALSIDSIGNLYVTGRSYNGANFDVITLKYDNNGNPLWARRFNNTANGADEGNSVGVDSTGNVYVVGSTWNGSNFDVLVLKYNAGSTQLWMRRYNGGNYDTGAALAIDSTDNVYLAGTTNNGANDDVITLKYDASGSVLWARRYNGTGGGNDSGNLIAIDGAGGIYVGGNTYNGANSDFLLLKYDASGGATWARRYNSSFNRNDYPRAMALDAAGKIVLCGNIENGSSFDVLTVRYDGAGTLLWAKRYNSPSNGDDTCYSVVIDSSANIYIAGASWNGTNNDNLMLRYNTLGTLVWSVRYNGAGDGQDEGRGIGVDGSGSVYVVGYGWSGANYDITVQKYTP